MYGNRRGQFLTSLEEQIVVLRPIAQISQDDSITGTISFGDETFHLSRFNIIISESDDQKIIILRNRLATDPDGILV